MDQLLFFFLGGGGGGVGGGKMEDHHVFPLPIPSGYICLLPQNYHLLDYIVRADCHIES